MDMFEMHRKAIESMTLQKNSLQDFWQRLSGEHRSEITRIRMSTKIMGMVVRLSCPGEQEEP